METGVTIFLDPLVLTCTPRHPGGRLSIVVRDGRIADISSNAEMLQSLYPGATTVDARNLLVTPGFVNAHFHAESLLLNDVTDGRQMSLWAHDVRFQERTATIADPASGDDLRALYLASCFNHLRCGTTCVAEFPPAVDSRGLAVILQAVRRTEVKAVLALQNWDQINAARDDFAGSKAFQINLGNEADLTVYSFDSLARAARERILPLVAHLAEQKEDVETVRRNFQKGAVNLLRDFNVLRPPTLLVHLNHASDEEMALVAESGCPVALCARSAALKRTGYPSLRSLGARSMRLCLGTDWGNVDMLGEMQFISQLPMLFSGMPVFSPLELLCMATINGAQALGLGDEIGSLAPGKKADMIFFSLDGVHARPLSRNASPEALASFLLHHLSTRDIKDVMIDGTLCVADGHIRTMPEETIMDGFDNLMQKYSAIGGPGPAPAPEPAPQEPEARAKIIPFVPSNRTIADEEGFEEGFSIVGKTGEESPKPASPPLQPTPPPPPPSRRIPDRPVQKPELSKNVRKVFGEDDDPDIQ